MSFEGGGHTEEKKKKEEEKFALCESIGHRGNRTQQKPKQKQRLKQTDTKMERYADGWSDGLIFPLSFDKRREDVSRKSCWGTNRNHSESHGSERKGRFSL